ncbi:MAG: pyridine nucleotide-disulfide oxidoreductase, partial [Deltaproteobacteria bacterium]|nr:pyridine nucleotide-disulfide oxidoreductase [Deltaproteobacteria bacterium]
STAIYGKMTLYDLESLDLAYAPPFSSANDPINIAAFVAAHEMRGEVKVISAENLNEDYLLIDVRNPDEIEKFGKLNNAIEIPLPTLRDRINEIPKNKKVALYCQKGQRGYLGFKILSQRGFDQVYNLKGGFLQAKYFQKRTDK